MIPLILLQLSSGVGEESEGVWVVPRFQSDYAHSMDLSAFICHEVHPSTPLPPDNPPPYTERLIEGHVSLMLGTGQDRDKDEFEEANSTVLTARDVSIQNRSMLNSEVYAEDTYLNVPEATNTSQYTDGDLESVAGSYTQDESIDLQRYNGVLVRSSTPTRVTRPLSVAELDPFYDSPAQSAQAPARQLFQRPARSNSIDNSSISLLREHQTTPEPIPVRPHRLAPLTPPVSPLQQEEDPDTRQLQGQVPLDWSANNPFACRPARLPPLRTLTGTQQRKRTRRKRGHSWHGGTITASSEQNCNSASSMATVAE